MFISGGWQKLKKREETPSTARLARGRRGRRDEGVGIPTFLIRATRVLVVHVRAHGESQSPGYPGRVNLFLSLRTEQVASSRISAVQGGAHKSAA